MKLNKINKFYMTFYMAILILLPYATYKIEAGSYKPISTVEEFNEIDRSTKPVIVMFSAPWCGPCKAMEPHFNSAAHENPNINFYKVDTSKPGLDKIADQYGIKGLPTSCFIYNREELNRISGGLSKRDLTNEVNSFISLIKKCQEVKKEPRKTKEIAKPLINTRKIETKKNIDNLTKEAKEATQEKKTAELKKEQMVQMTETNWNKIKEILEGLNKPGYKELINSVKLV